MAIEQLAFGGGPAAGPVPVAEAGHTAAAALSATPAGRTRDWAYLGVLAFTGVLLLRPQDQIRPLEVLHLAQLCAAIAIGAMVSSRLKRGLAVIKVTPEILGLTCFGFVIFATTPFSVWPGGALNVFADFLKVALVFAVLVNTLTTRKRIEQLTWLILACCGYIAFRAVLDYTLGSNLVENGRVRGAVSGIFGNPNDLALNMVTFMPAALMIALRRQQSIFRRLTASIVAVLMLSTIVFTQSRAGVLGFGAMMATFLFVGRRIQPVFTAGTLAAVLLATPLMPDSFWSRVSTIWNEDADKQQFTGSTEARRLLLQEAFNTFLDHPVTGVGAGQFANYNPPGRKERWREAHNSLLQVAADLGVFGFAAFAFLIGCCVKAALWTRRTLSQQQTRRKVDHLRLAMSADDRRALFAYVSAMTAGLAGWFVCAFFASVAYAWTFYYLLALLAATRDLVRSHVNAGRALEASKGAPGSSERFSSERERGRTWTPQIA